MRVQVCSRNDVARLRSSRQPCPHLFRRQHLLTASPAVVLASSAAVAAEAQHKERGAFDGRSATQETLKGEARSRSDCAEVALLEKAINHSFQSPSVGYLCTRHPSAGFGAATEFKEFSRLGVDVWAAICVVYLAAVYPKSDASCIATLAGAMATTEAILEQAEHMGLAPCLRFQKSPGLERPSNKMMKEFFYSTLAAVYLDTGLQAAYAVFSGPLESIRHRMPEELTQRCLLDATVDPSATANEAPSPSAAPLDRPAPRQSLWNFNLFGTLSSKSSPKAAAADAQKPSTEGGAAAAKPPASAQAAAQAVPKAPAALPQPVASPTSQAEADAIVSSVILAAAAPRAANAGQAAAARESAATKAWARLVPLKDLLASTMMHFILPGGKKPRGIQLEALSSAVGNIVEAMCSPAPAPSVRQASSLRALVGRHLWALALASQRMDLQVEAIYLDPRGEEHFTRKARADRAWLLLGLGSLGAAAAALVGQPLPAAAAAGGAGAGAAPDLAGMREEEVPKVTLAKLSQAFEAMLGAICLDSHDTRFEFNLAGQACTRLLTMPELLGREDAKSG